MGMYLSPKKGESDVAFDLRCRKATEIDCSGDELLTKQEFKDDADINIVIARCLKAGSIDAIAQKVAPVFADVSEILDYQTMVNRIGEAQDAFMLLPAKARAFFDNDPGKAVAFVQDPANLDKAVELGLAVKRPVVVEPVKAPVVPVADAPAVSKP